MKFQVSRVFRVLFMVLLCLMLLLPMIGIGVSLPPYVTLPPLAALMIALPVIAVQLVRTGRARFNYDSFRSWVLVRMMRTQSSVKLFVKIFQRSAQHLNGMVGEFNRVIKIPIFGPGY